VCADLHQVLNCLLLGIQRLQLDENHFAILEEAKSHCKLRCLKAILEAFNSQPPVALIAAQAQGALHEWKAMATDHLTLSLSTDEHGSQACRGIGRLWELQAELTDLAIDIVNCKVYFAILGMLLPHILEPETVMGTYVFYSTLLTEITAVELRLSLDPGFPTNQARVLIQLLTFFGDDMADALEAVEKAGEGPNAEAAIATLSELWAYMTGTLDQDVANLMLEWPLDGMHCLNKGFQAMSVANGSSPEGESEDFYICPPCGDHTVFARAQARLFPKGVDSSDKPAYQGHDSSLFLEHGPALLTPHLLRACESSASQSSRHWTDDYTSADAMSDSVLLELVEHGTLQATVVASTQVHAVQAISDDDH